MDENHLHHFADVEGLVGMFRENHRHERKVPAVFCGVFAASAVEEVRTTIDALESVDLENETKLRCQAVHVVRSRVKNGRDQPRMTRMTRIRLCRSLSA